MDKVTSADGTSIAFDVRGDGPPVVLVSGAIQHRAIDQGTERFADLLAERFTVARYDRRGRGDSGDTQPYAPQREIEDLVAVVEALGGGAAAYGMSSGCAVALDAAAAGAPLTRLALYELPAIVDDSRPPVPADYARRTRELTGGDALEYFMVEAIGMPREAVAGMRQDPSWAALSAVGHTIGYDAAFVASIMQGPSSLPELRRWAGVATPTLVLVGGDSPAFFHTGADALAAVLPNATRESAPGQTHQFDPDVLAPIVVSWLAADTRPAA